MSDGNPEFLTTKELADLLRIKERKVYDLVSSGDVPYSRATGKLLFPRAAVNQWVLSKSEGIGAAVTSARPAVFLGSHDPLLDWALRESGAPLATLFDGSLDGLSRFEHGEGIAAGIHIFQPGLDDWNLAEVERRFVSHPVVLMEFACRERGLIIDPGLVGQVNGFKDLRGLRLVPRQSGAGSQALLLHLLEMEGVGQDDVEFIAPARTETDAALAVREGKADVAFGLSGLARQYRRGFVPVLNERFDLLVDRWSWFESPFQALFRFCLTEAFRKKASEFEGYDVSGLGRIRHNSQT